jgi:pimeloyl-ACP methyl ester carboxylesterase
MKLFYRKYGEGEILSEDFSFILRLFPAVEFRVIKDAGHWVHVDNPEAVITEFNNLLKG